MSDKENIPFGKPWITEAERSAVLAVMDGPVLTHGPQNKAFEQEFAAFTKGAAYCAALSSGMAALHLSYLELGIGKGDEVIVPAQTHIATAHAVEAVGAKPVFLDCELETGNIDLDRLESLITEQTKAIGLVHFVGIPCDMLRVMEIADKHQLKVIEDCALAIGATVSGKHVGLWGDCGCFSFYPVKHITTGDGGLFITKNPEFAERVGKARAFGVDRSFAERSIPGAYDVPTLGLNYRMSDINASIGREQLKRLDVILERRKKHFNQLKGALSDVPEIQILDSAKEHIVNSHYCMTVIFRGMLADKRNAIIMELKSRGIGCSIYYPQPVPRMTYYKEKYGYEKGAYTNAATISDHSIALPVGPHLKEGQVERIANTLKEVIAKADSLS